MHLVLLPFEPGEKAADALVLAAVAVHDEPFLVGRQVGPRHVQPDAAVARRAFQVSEVRPVVRLAPRLDGVVLDRTRRVRHHEIDIEFDDVAESVAGRARAERIVEREQPRLRILVGDAAGSTLEALGEDVELRRRFGAGARAGVRQLEGERGTAPFAVRGLDRIGQPRQHVRLHAQPIDDDLQDRLVLQQRCLHIVERQGGAPVNQEAAEASPAKHVERFRNRVAPGAVAIATRDRRRLRACARRVAVVVAQFRGLVARIHAVDGRRPGRRHDGHLEADNQPGADRKRSQPEGDDLGALSDDLQTAVPAERPTDAREEQPEVVVDLGGGADGRSRVTDAVLLPDRDGRGDALDGVHVRLLHPLEELPGIGRQRLDVPPLPFRVDRVEGERRLPRPADAGHDDQGVRGQGDVDVLEVVRAGASNDEFGGRPRGRLGHGRRTTCPPSSWPPRSQPSGRRRSSGCRSARRR